MTKGFAQRLQVTQLKQKLQSSSDYDEIKRELEIMKVQIALILSIRYRLIKLSQYVEFAGGDVEGTGEDEEDVGEDDAANAHFGFPLS